MITLILNGPPTPYKAPNVFRYSVVNPRAVEKGQAQWQFKAQWNQKDPIPRPVRLDVTFHMHIPLGTSKAKRLQMLNNILRPQKRPDLDNLLKFLLDAMKGIIFEDDAQIVELIARKIYGEEPKTVILVDAIG